MIITSAMGTRFITYLNPYEDPVDLQSKTNPKICNMQRKNAKYKFLVYLLELNKFLIEKYTPINITGENQNNPNSGPSNIKKRFLILLNINDPLLKSVSKNLSIVPDVL
tara:strand:+ start:1387 stop:1713 length:327 start_codon:yes stop_codon:yes gene_type:complete